MSSIRVVIFLASLLLICTMAEAQKKLNLQQQVRLTKNEWPLDELLLEVTNQTGVPFSINTRKFPRSRKLQIKQRNQTVNNLLAAIRKSTGIAYTQVGSHIIMLDQLPAKATTGKEPVKKSNNAVGNKTSTKTKTISNPAPGTETINETTPQVNDLPPSLPGSVVFATGSPSQTISEIPVLSKTQVKKLLTGKVPVSNLPGTGNQSNTTTSSRNKREYQVYKGLFAQGGSSCDDALYVHNSVMAGHTYAYGIIGYTTNLRQSGIRYGIGGSVPLSSRWNMHLQLSTGKLDFKYDSLIITKVIRSTWHQVALKAEWKFAKQVRFQFGPVYNVLKSKTNFNNLTEPFQLTPFEVSMLGNHMHTLYTIKDEIGERAGTLLKTWIGLQAGFYFNLEFSK